MRGKQDDELAVPVKYIFGNKMDLMYTQKIKADDLETLAEDNVEIEEVSALTNKNVHETFKNVVEKMVARHQLEQSKESDKKDEDKKKEDGKTKSKKKDSKTKQEQPQGIITALLPTNLLGFGAPVEKELSSGSEDEDQNQKHDEDWKSNQNREKPKRQ